MKRLKKIRLINWHYFRDHSIEVNGNILLTGENASGKSTLLDAIQFVLTAGKAKFNIAANENAKRTLESYMRGKTGREGEEYLRNGDVVSQIALEYYDEESKDSFVIGVLLELSQGGKARKRFYVLHHCGIINDLFLDQNRRPVSFKGFQKVLKVRKIQNEISEKQNESQMMFRNVLGVAKKYHMLLPKALAFQPINDLNKFIFDFLLNEDPIQLDGLRENIRQYRHLETVMNEQKQRYNLLGLIVDAYEKFLKQKDKLEHQQLLKTYIYYRKTLSEVESLQQQCNQYERQITLYTQSLESIKGRREQVENDYFETRSALMMNDGFHLYNELNARQNSLIQSFNELKKQLQEYWSIYQKELKILSDLRISHSLPLSKDTILECSDLSLQLQSLCETLEERKETLILHRNQKNSQIQEASAELHLVQEEIRRLENKQFSYSLELTKLIELLETQIYEQRGEKVEIRPLCEYLEIQDETWRNAIEGYLNTQRFDLIIEPKYFNLCARIYERYKEDRKIYGIGVVNTAKLPMSEVKDGSLASKVDALNPYARQYANMLMNRVDLEEDIEKIKEHHIAMTPTCMIYRNVTLRSIHPSIYAKPYIGQKAIKIQLQQKKAREKELQEEIRLLRKSYSEFSRQLERLNQSQLQYLMHQSQIVIVKYVQTETEMDDNKKRLSEMKKDASWITLETQVEQLRQKLDALQLEYNDCNGQLSNEMVYLKLSQENLLALNEQLDVYQKEWEDIEGSYPALLPLLQEEFEKQRKNYRNDLKRMIQWCEDRLLRLEEACRNFERDVKDKMHDYNLQTLHGLGESLENYASYQEQYFKLKDIELDATLAKITEAQRKAESSFQEDFISRLRDKIQRAKEDIKKLNQTLKVRSFNGERYEFVINPNPHSDYKVFYDIIMSGEDYHANSLFMDELSERNRNLMQKLFNQLSFADTTGKSESLLHQYTDYRQYLSYDIKIHHEGGSYTLFSKVSKEKSGGETQTPYYVTIAASFEQLLQVKRMQTSSGCLVMLDEAFNNMDESRIEAMMRFYHDLNIQLLIAVPPNRIHTIAPYADSILTLVRKDQHILVGNFAYENS